MEDARGSLRNGIDMALRAICEQQLRSIRKILTISGSETVLKLVFSFQQEGPYETQCVISAIDAEHSFRIARKQVDKVAIG